jgi:hypothetical protein
MPGNSSLHFLCRDVGDHAHGCHGSSFFPSLIIFKRTGYHEIFGFTRKTSGRQKGQKSQKVSAGFASMAMAGSQISHDA